MRLALVNAAGAWASSLITMAQPPSPSPSPAPLCPLPVIPRRRVVFVVHCADASAPPESNTPLVIEPNGVYWRPEGHTRYHTQLEIWDYGIIIIYIYISLDLFSTVL